MSRVVSDCEPVGEALFLTVETMMNVVRLCLTYFFMAFTIWQLAIIDIVRAPILICILISRRKSILKKNVLIKSQAANAQQSITALVDSREFVFVANTGAHEIQLHSKLYASAQEAAWSLNKELSLGQLLYTTCCLLFESADMVIGFLMALRAPFELGIFVAYTSYASLFSYLLRDCFRTTTSSVYLVFVYRYSHLFLQNFQFFGVNKVAFQFFCVL
jgi:ABC-type bacteriocin/lantibiotic exporter with double-glycine peptidase domain